MRIFAIKHCATGKYLCPADDYGLGIHKFPTPMNSREKATSLLSDLDDITDGEPIIDFETADEVEVCFSDFKIVELEITITEV